MAASTTQQIDDVILHDVQLNEQHLRYQVNVFLKKGPYLSYTCMANSDRDQTRHKSCGAATQ